MRGWLAGVRTGEANVPHRVSMFHWDGLPANHVNENSSYKKDARESVDFLASFYYNKEGGCLIK